ELTTLPPGLAFGNPHRLQNPVARQRPHYGLSLFRRPVFGFMMSMRREVLIGGLLAALVVVLYWPAHRFEFVHYDDPQFITENEVIQKGLGWQGLAYAFTQPVVGNWHPLTTLSHMLDCELFGTRAGAHHVVNMFFHALNATLLFALLRSLTGAIWRSAMVAALFAFHPLRVESVAWISERKDLLSGLFFFLTIWAYARFVVCRDRKAESRLAKRLSDAPRTWYALALVCFALALMSKPMVVTLPFVLLLLDYWPLRRFKAISKSQGTRLLVEKIPFFALTAGFSVLTYTLQKKAGAMSLSSQVGLWERAANAAVSYVKYLGKTAWPSHLAVVYPHPGKHYYLNEEWVTWQVVAAVLVLLLLSLFCWVRAARQPWLPVGWFWFVGMLVPVIGLVQVGEQAMADRYTYLPSIGLCIGLVWTAHQWWTEIC